MLLEKAIENSKVFEQICTDHNPQYANVIQSIEWVREVLKEKGWIVYGGQAIDMALRLKNSKLYLDTQLPDFDFFTTDSVNDSYWIANEMYKRGFIESRAISAKHPSSMRVDIGDNNWIADLTYLPKNIFDMIPKLQWQEINFVHPDYQRIDLHNSLSYPYDNYPNEVIIERFEKDIKRFNLIDEFYPIANIDNNIIFDNPPLVVNENNDILFIGNVAIEKYMNVTGYINKTIEGFARGGLTKFAANNCKSASNICMFRKFGPLPERIEYSINNLTYRIYSNTNNLIPYKLFGNIKIANPQLVLKHLLCNYFLFGKSEIYLKQYENLFNAIKNTDPILQPLWGHDGPDDGQISNRMRLIARVDKNYIIPLSASNYSPHKKNGQLPERFDYNSSEIYQYDGSQMQITGSYEYVNVGSAGQVVDSLIKTTHMDNVPNIIRLRVYVEMLLSELRYHLNYNNLDRVQKKKYDTVIPDSIIRWIFVCNSRDQLDFDHVPIIDSVIWEDIEYFGKAINVQYEKFTTDSHIRINKIQKYTLRSPLRKVSITPRQKARLNYLYKLPNKEIRDSWNEYIVQLYSTLGALNNLCSIPIGLYSSSITLENAGIERDPTKITFPPADLITENEGGENLEWCEMFGSPLNTQYRFCSAFKFEAHVYGSMGSFFEFQFRNNGRYLANPPYDNDIMFDQSVHILKQLELVAAEVVVVIPVWDSKTQIELGMPDYGLGFPAFEILKESKFYHDNKASIRTDHPYFNYFLDKYINVSSTHFVHLVSGGKKPTINLTDLLKRWLGICFASEYVAPLK